MARTWGVKRAGAPWSGDVEFARRRLANRTPIRPRINCSCRYVEPGKSREYLASSLDERATDWPPDPRPRALAYWLESRQQTNRRARSGRGCPWEIRRSLDMPWWKSVRLRRRSTAARHPTRTPPEARGKGP